MGILTGLFKKKESSSANNRKELSWIALNSEAQLEEIAKKSYERPQFIFKHSTSCGISKMVLQMFTLDYELEEEAADIYYLDLHAYRRVSNEIAARFQVFHQSPQLLVIKGGVTVAHESHGAITEIDLKQFV